MPKQKFYKIDTKPIFKKSLQEFDGRARTRAGDEGVEGSGKWNRATKKSVVVSRYHIREID